MNKVTEAKKAAEADLIERLTDKGSDAQNSIFAGTPLATWLDNRPRELNSVRLTPGLTPRHLPILTSCVPKTVWCY